MGRRDRWKSDGPSTLDVNAYLEALAEHHHALCRFEIMPDPLTKATGHFLVSLVAKPGPYLECAVGPRKTQSVRAVFPNCDCQDLVALMYRLCVDIDVKLSEEWWEQAELPF